jgi:diguanylate cyclase (GGDEF)-like protein/PAS domain S-box-containing protein
VTKDLERQTTHFAAVQRLAKVGTWEVNLDDQSLYWSEQTYRIHDTTPQDYTPSLETAIQFYAPEWRPIITQALDTALQTGEGYDLELEIITTKGKRIWVHTYSNVVIENNRIVKFYGVILDIDDKKRTQLELEKSEFMFRSQFDLGRTGLAITSLEKGWLKVNQALVEITGYSKDELFNMTWAELTHPDDLDSDLSLFEKLVAGEIDSYRMDKRYIQKSGSIVYVHITVASYQKSGQIEFFIASIQDITERVLSEKKIRKLAHHDILTGLPNRVMAQSRFEHSMQSAQRKGTLVCIMFLDLDEFKNINDSLGHSAGDTYLIEISNRLTRIVRKSDTICRQGGDEFLIILDSITDEEQLLGVAEKVLEQIKAPYSISGVDVSISVSIGIAIAPGDGDDFETLCRHADMAMYQAKQAGRNSYHFFDHQLELKAESKLRKLSDLRLAIHRKQLEIHYQPKIDLNTNQLIGAEALIRWNHPKRGLILPEEFIPLAESSGLIIELGHWILEQACKQCQLWQQQGLRDLSVAVNVSAMQFKRDDFFQVIKESLRTSKLAANSLELEITESLLVADSQKRSKLFSQLNDLGVRISIDDFGTGYSNLGYLKKFQIDSLKIDRSFVANINSTQQDLAIVEAILQMAKSLQLNVVAEGVEERAVADKLSEMSCRFAQGFYWSKPLPNDDFVAFVNSF